MRYVRYVGLAHVRQISAADWRTAGITADSVQWDAFNGFAVPLDQFTDHQIQRVIRPDTGFVITGEGEDNQDEFVPDLTATRPMVPSELESQRVDILDPEPGSEPSTDDSAGSEDRSTPRDTTGGGTTPADGDN
jgi:hypothetical protein